MTRKAPLSRIAMRLLAVFAFVAAASTALDAKPWSKRKKSYEAEPFDVSSVPDFAHGDYTAISNNARLVEIFDENFDKTGLIDAKKKDEIFLVNDAPDTYSWYRGINDKRTTVGYTLSFSDFSTSAWMRDRHGDVRTFSDPAGSVYLYRVNNKDVAVGEVVYGDLFRPAIADGDGLSVIDVAGVPSDHPAYFSGINDCGAIVGGTFDPDTWEHTCLLWDRCGVTEITHEGASFVAPRAINNLGQVAGFWTEEPDLLGVEWAHGFIRERDGKFRTIDIEGDFEEELDFGLEELSPLIATTTKILDMNDKGELIVELTGWYLVTEEFDGEVFEYALPVWYYALATAEGCGKGR
jgi:hypothetical protein